MNVMNRRRTVVFCLVTTAVLCAGAVHGALTPPSDVCSVQQYNFDGDGAAGGSVDTGSSGADWVNHSVSSLLGAGWTVNSAANSDAAFFVDTTDNLGGGNGTLHLMDLVNSVDGTPMATLPFESGPATEGFLQFRAGTMGTQNENARVELMSGNTVLASLLLTSDSVGFFQFGGGKALFFDASWLNGFRTFQIAWTVNADGTGGKVSFFFDALLSGDLTLLNQAFLASGVPDQIRLSVGAPTDTSRGLRLADLDIRVSGNSTPAFDCPSDMTIECNAHNGGEGGAFVSYPPISVTAGCGAAPVVTFDPPSGSFFDLPEGLTKKTYTVTAMAVAGVVTNTCTFAVTLQDTHPPVFEDTDSPIIDAGELQQEIKLEADSGACFATLPFSKPVAVDACAPTVSVTTTAVGPNNEAITVADLGNGTLTAKFPIGLSTVTVVADDGHGNTAQLQTVVDVSDTQAPVLSCPEGILAAIPCGGTLVPPAPDAMDNCSVVSLVCTPSSVGPGVTPVVWTAIDASGNTNTCSYEITALKELRVKVLPPLQDDNVPDDINHDADGVNLFKPGQVLPCKVQLYDCDGMDVTATAHVQVLLEVSELDTADPSYHLVLPGGTMVLSDGVYQFNLKTSSYQPGTMNTSRFFRADIMVLDVETGLQLGEEDIRLESK